MDLLVKLMHGSVVEYNHGFDVHEPPEAIGVFVCNHPPRIGTNTIMDLMFMSLLKQLVPLSVVILQGLVLHSLAISDLSNFIQKVFFWDI